MTIRKNPLIFQSCVGWGCKRAHLDQSSSRSTPQAFINQWICFGKHFWSLPINAVYQIVNINLISLTIVLLFVTVSLEVVGSLAST